MAQPSDMTEHPSATFDKLDAYLHVAQITKFEDHFLKSIGDSEPIDVLLELVSPAGIQSLLEFAKERTDIWLNTSHLIARSLFVSGRMNRASVAQLAAQLFIARIELAQSLLPQRKTQFNRKPPTSSLLDLPDQSKQDAPSKSLVKRTLAAIIDHGCPFAHREYLRADNTTRVVTLWDQDPKPEFLYPGSQPPSGFISGREVTNSALQAWINESVSTDSSIDESRCYKLAGYGAMDVELTHGSHTLGLFAGKTYKPKKSKNDLAADCDIAFIQLPRQAVETPCASAIHCCILDGLRYLRSYAGVNGYDECVVVCDYGSYLGPHDGTSLFERALDAFLGEAGAQFQIVFPAGNCHDDALHAVLSPTPLAPASVVWNLPSHNETATYAELWIGKDDSKTYNVEIAVGDNFQNLPASSIVILAPWLVAVSQEQPDGQTQIVLRAAPTQVSDANTALAPSGPILIRVSAQNSGIKPVHAYLCWGGENIGFPKRMEQAWWSVPIGMQAVAKIEPDGTLLSSACGAHKDIYLIGGYVDNPAKPELRARSAKSSTGPSRAIHRLGPNFVAITDESYSVRGVPGPGTRSGIVRNMWGTSVAAPQAARALINGDFLPDTRSSALSEPENKIGMGYLD